MATSDQENIEELQELIEELQYEDVDEEEFQQIQQQLSEPEESQSEHIISDPDIHEPQTPDLPAPVEPEPQTNDISESLGNLATSFATTVNDVLSKSDEDRLMLDEAIDKLRDCVNQLGASRGAASFYEQWVGAMSKKADINIQKTKLLDSVAKLLAAAKNNDTLLGDQSSTGGDIDWNDIESKLDDE